MPFMVGSTGSVLPAPKRLVNDLVANENDDGAVGAKALDDATNKAKIDADRIFIVAFGCRYSVSRIFNAMDFDEMLWVAFNFRFAAC